MLCLQVVRKKCASLFLSDVLATQAYAGSMGWLFDDEKEKNKKPDYTAYIFGDHRKKQKPKKRPNVFIDPIGAILHDFKKDVRKATGVDFIDRKKKW